MIEPIYLNQKPPGDAVAIRLRTDVRCPVCDKSMDRDSNPDIFHCRHCKIAGKQVVYYIPTHIFAWGMIKKR